LKYKKEKISILATPSFLTKQPQFTAIYAQIGLLHITRYSPLDNMPRNRADGNVQAAVAPGNLKLPKFWTSNPVGWWFQTIEAQFALHNIMSDATRYNYVLSVLGNDPSTAIEGFLDNPPNENLYDNLKTELIKVYGLTDKQKKRLVTQYHTYKTSLCNYEAVTCFPKLIWSKVFTTSLWPLRTSAKQPFGLF